MRKKKSVELANIFFNIEVSIDEDTDKVALKKALRGIDKVTDVSAIDDGLTLSVEFNLVDNLQHTDHRVADAKRAIERVLTVYKYRTVTGDEGEEIWKEVDEWEKNAPSVGMFSSAKSVMRSAVAEYIANQKNLSLYEI